MMNNQPADTSKPVYSFTAWLSTKADKTPQEMLQPALDGARDFFLANDTFGMSATIMPAQGEEGQFGVKVSSPNLTPVLMFQLYAFGDTKKPAAFQYLQDFKTFSERNAWSKAAVQVFRDADISFKYGDLDLNNKRTASGGPGVLFFFNSLSEQANAVRLIEAGAVERKLGAARRPDAAPSAATPMQLNRA